MSHSSSEPEFRNGERVRRGPYPEFTAPAIVVGWFLGGLIAVSIGYASLKLGFSIEGSELAAILGWGILRGLMRRTSIVENNINQTIASSVNGAASGVMFCVPALFILSRTEGLETVKDFNVWLMIFSCITGAFIGLAFVIPLRKQMIDFDRLPYPGGIAVAAILKSPGAGIRKAILLMAGSLISAVVYLVLYLMFKGDMSWSLGRQLNVPFFMNLTFFLSLMTVGVGFLSGKGGFWFGAGGFICYWLLAPLLGVVGSESSKDMINPPVRQAFVQQSDLPMLKSALPFLEANSEIESELQNLIGELEKAPETVDEAKSIDPGAKYSNLRESLDGENAKVMIDVMAALDEKTKSPEAVSTTEPNESGDSSSEESSGDGSNEKNANALEQIAEIKAVVNQIRTTLGPQTAFSASEAMINLKRTSSAMADEVGDATRFGKLKSLVDDNEVLSLGEKQAILEYAGYKKQYKEVPSNLQKKLFKPTGIGMLIGAAIGGILMAFPLVMSAFGSLRDASKNRGKNADAGRDEMPLGLLIGIVGTGLIILVIIGYTSAEHMTWFRAIAMAVLGTVWVWIAGVIVAECIGRTNWSPLSGMTLIAVTILILIAGSGIDSAKDSAKASSVIISSVIVGAAICLAISQASDMMLDLKSGYLVGAIPRRQQFAQFIGAWLGPFVVVWLLIILSQSYELGSDDLPAPQGQALAGMINGLVANDIPTYRYTAGGILGLLLAVSGLGGIGVMVALGFYMPFHIVLTYTIGCVLRISVDKGFGKSVSETIGIPIAAGLIVGEALVGVGIAVYKILVG